MNPDDLQELTQVLRKKIARQHRQAAMRPIIEAMSKSMRRLEEKIIPEITGMVETQDPPRDPGHWDEAIVRAEHLQEQFLILLRRRTELYRQWLEALS